jgi:predicted acylesterase/phospholipase RssA
MSKPDSISFSGCGTLNFYQVGVAAALQEEGWTEGCKFAGASAGAGLSVLMAGGVDAHDIFRVAQKILAPHRGKNIILQPKILWSFADQYLDSFFDPQLLEKIDDRVFLSIAQLKPFKKLLINQFSDLSDLHHAIRASCHIPSRKRPSHLFRGYPCMDGGFRCNTPIISNNHMSITPFFFDRRMTVQPSHPIGPWWSIIIPSERRMEQLFELGKRNGSTAILRRKQSK